MRKEKQSAQVLLGLGSIRVQDTEVPNLQIYRAKRNGITFVLYSKIGGRPVMRVIGVYPNIGIEEAWRITRDLVLELREQAKLKRRCSCDCHINRKPLPPDVDHPKAITLGRVLKHYFKNRVLKRCRTFEAILRNFERYFDLFAERPACSITPVAHRVSLVPAAIDVLRAKPVKATYVFPARRGESGLSDLRPHDLRRTVGTWQAMTGASLVTIARTLGHRDFKSTAVYARLPLDAVRDLMNTAVDAMTRRNGQEDIVSES